MRLYKHQSPIIFKHQKTIKQPQQQTMAASATKQSLLLLASLLVLIGVTTGSFYDSFDITWGAGRANIFESGQLLTCTLDKISGSGFQSKKEYLFGKIDMKIKLVAGNSAGTVTAYYVCKTSSISILLNIVVFNIPHCIDP